MNQLIDARGIAADRLWQMIRENMAAGGTGRLTTITDSPDKARFIRKMAVQSGLESYSEETGGDYFIHFNPTALQETGKTPAPGNAVVVITGCTFGRGEDILGKTLMKSFLYHIRQSKPYPRAVIFLNGGVWLTTEGSEVLADLRALAEKGVEILSCATCLSYYGLKDRLAVGGIAEMKEITERMQRGENTVVL